MEKNLVIPVPSVHQDWREIPRKTTEIAVPKTPTFNLYVATSYGDAPVALELHTRAREVGIAPVSSWAEKASGPEHLANLPRDVVRRIARANDRDLLSAHLVAVLAREGAGAEMFAEARLALAHRIPLLWIGARRPLSAYREGVFRVENLSEAMLHLCGFVDLVKSVPRDAARRTTELLWTVIESLNADEGKGAPASSTRSRRGDAA